MRKVKINDNQGKSIEVDIDQFKKHLDEYHSTGSSVHDFIHVGQPRVFDHQSGNRERRRRRFRIQSETRVSGHSN